MDKYSARIKIRKDRIRKDGTSLLYMQVIINSKTDKINLELYWPPERFDEEALCLKRDKKDSDANDYNMILRSAVSKANDIFKYFRLSGLSLNIETFRKEYHNYLSKTDFILFMEKKIADRWRRQEISERTHLNHLNTLNRLKDFKKEMPFRTLNNKFPGEFEFHLKKTRKNSAGTIWLHHKNVTTYLNYANQDYIKFENPYIKPKGSLAIGKWKPLDKEDLNRLLQYYREQKEGSTPRRILQQFLFGCCTGLRISDLHRLKHDWLINGSLVFTPHKTKKDGKVLELPLTSMALELINDSLRENPNTEGFVFRKYAGGYTGRVLKAIALVLDIKINMHPHVARETFATLYLELGGNVEVLQKYLAHSSIVTTMRYVHVSQQRKKDEMKRMENLFGDNKQESPAK